MTAKDRLNARLDAAVSLARGGDGDGARAMLAEVGSDPEVGVLGPRTALGLPRRLHAAHLRVAKACGDAVARTGYQAHLVPPPGVLAAFADTTADEARALAAAACQPVPRVIHQVWIGDREAPATVAAWADHARAQGYDHRLWREADLEGLGVADDPIFRDRLARRDFPGAVDAARYAILARDGGVYLDCDWYPPGGGPGLHDLVPMAGLIAMAEAVPRLMGRDALMLANSFIAAPPGHPAMVRLTQVLPDVARALPGAPAWWATGPVIFTRIARRGPLTLAGDGFMAGALPSGATLAEARAFRAGPGGFLLAWKPW